MTVNSSIMFVMAVGILLGGADCILNNRFGLGEKFEEAFKCLGPTALSMVGIICLAPKLAEVFGAVIVPLYRFVGADPAMFASIFATDMGGYPLAVALAENPQVGLFSGLIVASMLGATIVFTIPLGLNMIMPEDREYFAKGLLIGLTTIPIGSLAGGIMMGLSVSLILINLIPVFLIGILLILGLVFAQEKMVQGFVYFGRGIKTLTVIGLCAAAFEYMTGIALIKGMPPIMEAMRTVSGICIVLLGSLPLMTLIVRILKHPFEALGKVFQLDSTSIAGLLFSCISVLPVFRMMKDMCPRGKVIVTAFLVSSIAVFAAHLGFTVEAAPDMLVPMMTAKLTSGGFAVIFALIFTAEKKGKECLREKIS